VERVKIAYKVWLDNDGKAFGEGPYRILKQIEKVIEKTYQKHFGK